MSYLFDRVNVKFCNSKAEQSDEKTSKKATPSYGYGQVSGSLVTSGSAVNPVLFSSPDRPEKSDSSIAGTKGEPEQINELHQLRQFTIPKKRKAKKGKIYQHCFEE